MTGKPEWVSGNIFIRPHVMREGEEIGGHTHSFDHTTIFFTGRCHVRAEYPDGRVIEREFVAPSHCLIRAQVKHTLTALEDGTQLWCVYSHRNPQGQVVQDYDGWYAANV